MNESDPPSTTPQQPPQQPDESADGAGRLVPHLHIGEVRRGSRPGSRYIRVERTSERPLRRTGTLHWRATEIADRPRSRLAQLVAGARHLLFGSPLPTAGELSERLTKLRALAVFASDALSSTAYATEEILLVLLLAGTTYLDLAFPISIAITLLMVMVVISYRQTIQAYPRGGGAYTVSRDNLGHHAGLVAAAALMVDYVLTVAVSISAGILAIISAIPDVDPYRVPLAVGAVLFMALVNLRGVRESGAVLSLPAYLFIGVFAAMLVGGIARLALGQTPEPLDGQPAVEVGVYGSVSLLLLLRAFSSGSTALTGIEAIANGVQAFEPPESRNAATTMTSMAVILAIFFVGATFLAVQADVIPLEGRSVISQLGLYAFGGMTPPFYLLQAMTALILVLAANTAFNGLPRLAAVIARDGFLPRQFGFRGDRLEFSYGILGLAGVASLLLILFAADTHALIPLYAVGVFLAFTLSQTGMALRWIRRKDQGWRMRAILNGGSAVVTGIVTLIVAYTKFAAGAWIVLVLIPLLVLGLEQIHRHLERVRREVELPEGARIEPPPRAPDEPMGDSALVLVRQPNLVSKRALEYTLPRYKNVLALHVARDDQEAEGADVESRWAEFAPTVPLVVLDSPYRSFLGPVLAYIDGLALPRGETLTVVLPEYRSNRWWQRPLHNGTARPLAEALLARPNTRVLWVSQHGPSERGD